MAHLRLATAANVRAFQSLAHALDSSHNKWSDSVDQEALQDEEGRFRVWSGNLGALQKGHSSLDYRLRDSPLLSTNALKFLHELEDNLNQAYAIVAGVRLPYEQQPAASKQCQQDDPEDDDGFFSEGESGDDEGSSRPRTELSMRFLEVVDIIDNLYKLSVRIRTPTIRIRSLKAASYEPKDPDTGVNLLSVYAVYDLSHVKELLTSLRQPHLSNEHGGDDSLATRLAAATTLRRRQFKYWKRHRDKLGVVAAAEDRAVPPPTPLNLLDPLAHVITHNANADGPLVNISPENSSQKTGRTLLSVTEATHHHQSLDDIVDTKSVTSYAITVKDMYGRGVDLPPPPKEATQDKDFECPYCYIICPARYGHGRGWRTHLLQDLQPYCCTYSECDRPEQLFRSRREWAEHEANHRKVWRCPEHPDAVYKSKSGLENHLRQDHLDSFPEQQLPTIVKVGETTTVDVRTHCPICFVAAETPGIGDFQSHVANHLERIATFALPSEMDHDPDDISDNARHGGSGSTDSQKAVSSMNCSAEDSEYCLGSNDTAKTNDAEIDQSLDSKLVLGSAQTLLSADSLQQLPDSSRNRLDMIAVQLKQVDVLDEMSTSEDLADDSSLDSAGEDTNQSEDGLKEIQKHSRQREALRVHLLSLPYASSVRFYKRYGSWTGRVDFPNEVSATQALTLFDKEQFPNIRLFQSADNSSKLRFMSFAQPDGKTKQPSRKSTATTQDSFDPHEQSPRSFEYETEEQRSKKQPVLMASDIPTLRSLYRSRKILPRDQSYEPNDKYNQMISFCSYDLTRLKVDAIINSSYHGLSPTRGGATLNNEVHKAAGPGLWEETKSKAKLKAGQTELSHGHDLPSSWIIHAARPRFSTKKKSMGQFNLLTECYRSALKMANNYEFKTIAFPSLGTGGCGFPPRIAARLALQEVREYLDAHADSLVERIVFCVNTVIDEKAYMDFFPVFFPPTHGDLERARLSTFPAQRAALAAEILETRGQVQKVHDELFYDFSLVVSGFDGDILQGFNAIDASLASIRGFLLGPQEFNPRLDDLNLICSILQMITSRLMEMIDIARDTRNIWQKNKKYWARYEAYMRSTHGTTFTHISKTCQAFVQNLEDTILRNAPETEEMAQMRLRLEAFSIREKEGDGKEAVARLDEALYTREFRRTESLQIRNTIKLQQIPSLDRLYQDKELGMTATVAQPVDVRQEHALSLQPTLARPSAVFNQIVCLIREDITRLEVDVMVNSTDVSFLGMGTLDRLVFKKGGPELRDQVKQFGTCNRGDVKLTLGYLLPAKHILHVIPPEIYKKENKSILRNIYREIFFTASSLRATSVALPCIGTGMLSYPIRDCASLAMEEVKRFLESAEPTSSIEKIVFVVFSSIDESMYKSLLPVYFPPVQPAAAKASQKQAQEQAQDGDSMSVMADTKKKPRRTLFGSVSEALRGVRSGKQPQISRNLNHYEENSLNNFERHVDTCHTCMAIEQKQSPAQSHSSLCAIGDHQAELLLETMEMSKDKTVHTKPDTSGESVKLLVPENLYPASLQMLLHARKTHSPVRDTTLRYPEVPSEDLRRIPDSTHAHPIHQLYGFRVAAWSPAAAQWELIHRDLCRICVTPDQANIFAQSDGPAAQPWLTLSLAPTTSLHYHETNTQLLLANVANSSCTLVPAPPALDRILFLSPQPRAAAALLHALCPPCVRPPTEPPAATPTPPRHNTPVQVESATSAQKDHHAATSSPARLAESQHRYSLSRFGSRLKTLVNASAISEGEKGKRERERKREGQEEEEEGVELARDT